MQHFSRKNHVLAVAISSLFCTELTYAQSNAATPTEDTPVTVIMTGTRMSNRTVLNTTAPLDVISAETLKNVGVS